MTWNYDNAPGVDTENARRDAVRITIGDTDVTDQQVTDEAIAFALSQSGNDYIDASIQIANQLAAKFSRLVDTSAEGLSMKYSQLKDQYLDLATRLKSEAARVNGPGLPLYGGTSIGELEALLDDGDLVQPAFRRGQFRNPSTIDDDDYYRGG